MKRETLVAWMFPLVAVLSFIAAFLPVLRGRPMNVTFLAVGVIWLVVAAAAAKRNRKKSGNQGDQVK